MVNIMSVYTAYIMKTVVIRPEVEEHFSGQQLWSVNLLLKILDLLIVIFECHCMNSFFFISICQSSTLKVRFTRREVHRGVKKFLKVEIELIRL